MTNSKSCGFADYNGISYMVKLSLLPSALFTSIWKKMSLLSMQGPWPPKRTHFKFCSLSHCVWFHLFLFKTEKYDICAWVVIYVYILYFKKENNRQYFLLYESNPQITDWAMDVLVLHISVLPAKGKGEEMISSNDPLLRLQHMSTWSVWNGRKRLPRSTAVNCRFKEQFAFKATTFLQNISCGASSG